MNRLSLASQSLWAKKQVTDCGDKWLPLTIHMSDSAAVARKLWNQWTPDGALRAIEEGLSQGELGEQVFAFLAACHDLGKATPVFQAKPAWPPSRDLDDYLESAITSSGLPMRPNKDFAHASKTPHALASQVLLEHAGCHVSLAAILGAHHGRPSELTASYQRGLGVYAFNYHLEKEGERAWSQIWQELVAFALELSGFSALGDLPQANMASQVVLSAMVIVADWVASNEELFPLVELGDVLRIRRTRARIETGWKGLGLPKRWTADNTWMRTSMYRERFDFARPTSIQAVAFQAVSEAYNPGILVLEASMGSGKTEAALVCAEVMAQKTGRNGVFFALPTQATSDGVFPRMLRWANKVSGSERQSIRLVHGKAEFNEDYQSLKFFQGSTHVDDYGDSGVFVHHWFEGSKTALLADFVVGTVDHLLLAALKQKHVMLRHLGLVGKVVIIDECHAYDAYMGQYLFRILNWLGAYRVPVIVLSATLPASIRQNLIEAYLNCSSTKKTQTDPLGRGVRRTPPQPKAWVESRDYPIVTYTDGGEVKQVVAPITEAPKKVVLQHIEDSALVDTLEELLAGGGCAGVVVNTVKRAQEIGRTMRERFGEETVRILHSRFIAPHRREKERELLEELGPPDNNNLRPHRRIVIGTQVLEQSLDIDFDLLVTDLCPMDLLLQRIGRLRRHSRVRPPPLDKAHCFILGVQGEGFDEGSKHVYGEYLLMRTKALLPDCVQIPEDIPRLVQSTYDDTFALAPEPLGYQNAVTEHRKVIADKEKRARDFRIGPLTSGPYQNLLSWLDTSVWPGDKQGEAAVRDSDESVEVLLVHRIDASGRIGLIGSKNTVVLDQTDIPDNKIAWEIAKQGIRLPSVLCKPWIIDKTIAELEQLNAEQLPHWQQSRRLKGELLLLLDEAHSAMLCGYRLTYDVDYGLLYSKEVDKSER